MALHTSSTSTKPTIHIHALMNMAVWNTLSTNGKYLHIYFRGIMVPTHEETTPPPRHNIDIWVSLTTNESSRFNEIITILRYLTLVLGDSQWSMVLSLSLHTHNHSNTCLLILIDIHSHNAAFLRLLLYIIHWSPITLSPLTTQDTPSHPSAFQI